MTFEVTTEPQRFNEAADWFLKRQVLTGAEAAQLSAEAARRAFWIGGGLQLSQIQRVFDKLGKAVEDGTPFDEWRKQVRDELRNDAHAETVFRNATQRALNVGRWRQMREPGVLAFRPYWLFDGIDDSRQSPICRKCNGVILPADHAWWHTHTPQLHHRCRSSIRNLRRSEAQRRGITNVPPVDGADEGFGLSPEREPDWKPAPDKTDPALLRELEAKATKPRKQPPAPKEPPKEHDPKHWEAFYAEKYGDSATNVAWGRAMLERGLDRTPAEIIDQLDRLKSAGVPGDWVRLSDELGRLKQDKPLRKQLLLPRDQFAAMLTEHSRTIERGDVLDLGGPGAGDTRITEAKQFYSWMLDKAVRRPAGWRVSITEGLRAYATPLGDILEIGSEPTPVTVHELAHAIEFTDARALRRSLAFLEARTKGEALRSLRELTDTMAYGENERARPDKFVKAYIGKDYGGFGTEVTSMGYQALAGDRLLLKQMAERDPELLFFSLGQLAGR
jgi:SPP1 gp7 family putative phage head morphogenesis protein